MNISIVGMGFVGLSNALLLAQNHNVLALDVLPQKIKDLNNAISPIQEDEIVDFLLAHKKNKTLNRNNPKVKSSFKATLDKKIAFEKAELIIIATPTDYDPVNNNFNTDSVESVIRDVNKINPKALILIKSTVPVGFTEKVKEKYGSKNILFSPEFLREGSALYDNLYPSRIIIGEESVRAKKLGEIFKEAALKKNIPILYTSPTEAEAIKLFSNSYLALRVSYFNELDSYAETYKLNTKHIIDGMCLDPRIGQGYNNPSFGYGGYCLPKDTKQLKSNFEQVPNAIINAIVESNQLRKEHIAKSILKRKPNIIGIYRLIMKSGSDNFRESAINDIVTSIIDCGKKIVIYEPVLSQQHINSFLGCKVIENFQDFSNSCDLIISNRLDDSLEEVKEKVYTRDIFNLD